MSLHEQDVAAGGGAGWWTGVRESALESLLSNELNVRWSGTSTRLESICRYALLPGGKMFRPILLAESAMAVGGDVATVLPAAIGAECGHVASLIHDDIIDKDEMRRGRPSVPTQFGADDAIIAGDMLIFTLFASLAECRHTGASASRIVSALEAVARAGRDLCRGQAMEAELCELEMCDVASYLTMVSLKTAAFFRGACECGAILGGGKPSWVQALAAYGTQLGIAFQIHDDLLGYTSDSATTGKPSTSDIRNGRLTLPVILAYEGGSPGDRELIGAVLAGRQDVDEALATMVAVFDRTRAIQQATAMARHHAASAIADVERLPSTPSTDRMKRVAQLAVDRFR